MLSASRDIFLERLRILSNALVDPLLIDLPPVNIDHNERARVLRNGLAIVSFNILEDFIKSRIAEVFANISNCGIPFNSLPSRIQDAALLHSLKGIHTVSNRKRKAAEDYKLFIQQETEKIASTIGNPFTMSALGFGWEKSNLDYSDLESFVKAFQIVAANTSIQTLTSTIGCAILSPKDFFQNAAERRHAAAHSPSAISSHSDLVGYAVTVKAFALAFDMLISAATRNIISRDIRYLTAGRNVEASDIKLRYIRKVGNIFQEMSKMNTSVIKAHSTETNAVTALRGRTNYQSEMIVILDFPSKVFRWYTAI